MTKEFVDEVVKLSCEAHGLVVSVRNAARLFGTDRALVYAWREKGCIPPQWAFVVHEVTCGRVLPLDLLGAWVEKNPPASDLGGVN